MDKYEDIINLPHPTSKRHPRMSLYDRAAQFSPFAALTGHEEAVKETARLTDQKLELSDDTIERLNEKISRIAELIDSHPEISITYFVPDSKKTGGTYDTYFGKVKKIDEYNHTIVMIDKTIIPIEQISEIDGDIFQEIF